MDIDVVLEPIVHAASPEAGLRAGAIAIGEHGRLPILMSAVATKVGQWCNDAEGRTVEQCAEVLGLPVGDVIDLRLRGGEPCCRPPATSPCRSPTPTAPSSAVGGACRSG